MCYSKVAIVFHQNCDYLVDVVSLCYGKICKKNCLHERSYFFFNFISTALLPRPLSMAGEEGDTGDSEVSQQWFIARLLYL